MVYYCNDIKSLCSEKAPHAKLTNAIYFLTSYMLRFVCICIYFCEYIHVCCGFLRLFDFYVKFLMNKQSLIFDYLIPYGILTDINVEKRIYYFFKLKKKWCYSNDIIHRISKIKNQYYLTISNIWYKLFCKSKFKKILFYAMLC